MFSSGYITCDILKRFTITAFMRIQLHFLKVQASLVAQMVKNPPAMQETLD